MLPVSIEGDLQIMVGSSICDGVEAASVFSSISSFKFKLKRDMRTEVKLAHVSLSQTPPKDEKD